MVPFKITEKTLKYLEINLTKDVNYLYEEDYKTFKKWNK